MKRPQEDERLVDLKRSKTSTVLEVEKEQWHRVADALLNFYYENDFFYGFERHLKFYAPQYSKNPDFLNFFLEKIPGKMLQWRQNQEDIATCIKKFNIYLNDIDENIVEDEWEDIAEELASLYEFQYVYRFEYYLFHAFEHHFQYYDPQYSKNPNFLLLLLEKIPQKVRDAGYDTETADEGICRFLRCLNKYYVPDKTFCEKLAANIVPNLQKYVLKYASDDLRKDPDFVYSIVKKHCQTPSYGKETQHIHRFLDEDYHLSSFKFASKELQEKEYFFMRILEIDGLALQFIPDHLKTRDVVFCAVKSHGNALEFAPEQFKDDKRIVIEAVKNNSQSWKFASQELQTDSDVFIAAVKNDPALLKEERYWTLFNIDKKILLEIVKENAKSLEFLPSSFKNSPDIFLPALINNFSDAWEFIHNQWKIGVGLYVLFKNNQKISFENNFTDLIFNYKAIGESSVAFFKPDKKTSFLPKLIEKICLHYKELPSDVQIEDTEKFLSFFDCSKVFQSFKLANVSSEDIIKINLLIENSDRLKLTPFIKSLCQDIKTKLLSLKFPHELIQTQKNEEVKENIQSHSIILPYLLTKMLEEFQKENPPEQNQNQTFKPPRLF